MTGKVIYTPEETTDRFTVTTSVGGGHNTLYQCESVTVAMLLYISQVDTTSNVGPALFIVDGKGMPTSSNFDEAPLSFTSKRGSHGSILQETTLRT